MPTSLEFPIHGLCPTDGFGQEIAAVFRSLGDDLSVGVKRLFEYADERLPLKRRYPVKIGGRALLVQRPNLFFHPPLPSIRF